MAARSIPVARSRSVELYHDPFNEHRIDAHEDRLLAICVELSRRNGRERQPRSLAGWPAPILVPRHRDAPTSHRTPR